MKYQSDILTGELILCFVLFILFNPWLLKLSLFKDVINWQALGWRVYTLRNGEG